MLNNFKSQRSTLLILVVSLVLSFGTSSLSFAGDYAPKVGYRLTESLHLTREADGSSLFTRTITGSR